jgi:2-succinyl-5-enolpyruvyl-6-hydroxy-3-cyclohexene-1-carboxylate synthase
MIPENAAYAYVGVFMNELARAGVRHLCLCPGSRSTPIAMCAARERDLTVWTLIDERSAAFFALGMAKELRAPVALLSTSGTAAANFLPAVVEAKYSRVPLVVLTADRPHELRDVGANQTIDQIHLYGTHVKWFVEAAPPEATAGMLRYARTLAGHAAAIARGEPSGPVHLNFPLREPLVPVADPGPWPAREDEDASAWDGRGDEQPYVRAHAARRTPDDSLVDELARELTAARRGVVICGPLDVVGFPAAVTRLGAALGYPTLADPLSQVRCGPHDRSLVVDSYDALLRIGRLGAGLAPDVILRFGATPASRPLAQYMTVHGGARQIVVDAGGGWGDPSRLAAEFVHADPLLACEALSSRLPRPAAREAAWATTWQRLAERARDALQRRLAALDEIFEGKVFAELSAALPDGALLYVGNSMPVRDLDSFFAGNARRIRILGNRGASGIDGVVSSALGAAAAAGGPVVLVLGDLAFYHDMNGLLAARLHGLNATIVVLNNDGGGIFSFLPQAAYPEYFEALFGTPHGLEFRHAAALYGAAYHLADAWEAFRDHLAAGLSTRGLSIVEVRTDRQRNVTLHQEMWLAVESALRDEALALST